MSPIYIALIGIVIFWLVVKEIDRRYNLSNYGIDFQGVILLWRTEKFNELIDTVSKKGRKLWNLYGLVGIGAAVIGMVGVFYLLFSNAVTVILSLTGVIAPPPAAGVGFIIPGITVPFWYSIIGIIVVLIVHEASHGIVARANKIDLKSVGLALFLVIPGAFVEPDEESVQRSSRLARMKVYSAGSMANFVTALVAFVLIVGAINPLLTPSGIEVVSIEEASNAFGVLSEGDIIKEINGVKIESLENFYLFMEDVKPGDELRIVTDRGTFNVLLSEHPSDPGKGYIGIFTSQNFTSQVSMGILIPVSGVLFWIFLLNLNIGLINLFPLPFLLDGGKVFKEIVDTKFSEEKSNMIQKAFALIGIMLFLINILPSFL